MGDIPLRRRCDRLRMCLTLRAVCGGYCLLVRSMEDSANASSKKDRTGFNKLIFPENKPHSQRCTISVYGDRVPQGTANEL